MRISDQKAGLVTRKLVTIRISFTGQTHKETNKQALRGPHNHDGTDIKKIKQTRLDVCSCT